MRVYYSSEDFSLTSEGDKTVMSRFPRVAAVALTASLLIPAGGLAASDASAEYMAADASIIDPTPTPWERIEIKPDGQSLRVFFSTGAAGCYGLARVDVDRSNEVPVLTLWTGLRPDAAARICDAMNYDYYTEVALDAPVVLDGSGADEQVVTPTTMGPGISVSDVDSAPAGQVLLLNGSLLVGPDGEVRLWEGFAESSPPQGAGDSLLVTGLDESAIDWNEAGGVRWVADVQLLGRVEDGVLVIDPLVK